MSLETLLKKQEELEAESKAWININPILWKKAHLELNEVTEQIDLLKQSQEKVEQPVIKPTVISIPLAKKKIKKK